MGKKISVSAQDYIEKGQFYLINKKYSEAIKQFQKALKLKPDVLIYFHLGLAYEASCQIPQAIEMFRKAIELDANHKEAIEHLNSLTNQ